MRAGKMDRQCTVERLAVVGDAEYLPPDPVYGTPRAVWRPLVYQPGSPSVAQRFWGEKQDSLPSRDENVTQGLAVARNQVRWRMRWRNDIDSSMRVTIHGAADELFQIVGGPAEIEGRKVRIELMLEKYSS